MANKDIRQGAISDVIIQPTWGTIERQGEDNTEERLLAIAGRIERMVSEKAGFMQDMLAPMGLTYYDNAIYVKPDQGG